MHYNDYGETLCPARINGSIYLINGFFVPQVDKLRHLIINIADKQSHLDSQLQL